MTSLPTDSFKITLTTTTTTEIIENNDITSSSIESSEPENSLDVTIPENITKSTSLYVNQDLNRSAMSLATVDYIVPSNDPRNSTQIFKLQFIDYSEFVDISPLGDSKSITILVGTWKKNDKDIKVALKKVESLLAFSQANNDDYNETSESKALVDNINLLYKLSFHKNILPIFGYSQNPQSGDYFMILQYADGGNLRQYLQENHSKLSWTDKVRIIIDIASGLQYIHNHDIVHLSLHPQNILIHNGQLMISDLGISKSTSQKSSIIPSLPYIDPNFLSSSTYPRDKHSDIYSLGILMHDVTSGKKPFENLPYNEPLAIRLFEGLRLRPIGGTPLELVDLYEQCWDVDANIRPTISDVLARLGRLKFEPVWVDKDEIIHNGGKKSFNVEFNDDIKGVILESKHTFGTGSVTFSNGNISSKDIEINESEIYGEEEEVEKGCIQRRHKFGIFICWIVIFCAAAFAVFFFAVIKFATSKN